MVLSTPFLIYFPSLGRWSNLTGSTRIFFPLMGWWKTTKKGGKKKQKQILLMKNHQKRWKKTDVAALGRPIFVALPGGWWGKLYLCNLDEDNEPPGLSITLVSCKFSVVKTGGFLPFQLCNRLKNTGGLTQPGCWFCIYVNAQDHYATRCKSQLFSQIHTCLVGGFR